MRICSTKPDRGHYEFDRLVQGARRRVGIISPTIKPSGHEEASGPPGPIGNLESSRQYGQNPPSGVAMSLLPVTRELWWKG
jgi:hypothetical protein